MLGSDSGSSDLSDGSSLSSDNSSGSETELQHTPNQHQQQRKRQQQQQKMLLNTTRAPPQPTAPSIPRPNQRTSHSGFSSASSSSAVSDNDLDSDGSSDDDTNGRRKPDAPISLSASQAVYTNENINRSMKLSPANSKFSSTTALNTTRGRGRGRGRGRAPSSGHGSRGYNASTEASTVIDFDDLSAPIEEPSSIDADLPSTALSGSTSQKRKKKETAGKNKTSKSTSLSDSTGKKQKQGARKVGRPKSVAKNVYCICREPYDGVEFMIACDRCEEWFHGRCIGMKPQEAKKSSHYYCDTCQRIRRILGVSTTDEELSKPARNKQLAENQTSVRTESSSAKAKPKQPSFKIKLKPAAAIATSPRISTINIASYADSFPQTAREFSSTSAKASNNWAGEFDDTEESHLEIDDISAIDAVHSTGNPSLLSNSSPSAVARIVASTNEEDDEDVCPVCDFQCTCNASDDRVETPMLAKSEPTIDIAHANSATKVPFQPAAVATPTQDTVDQAFYRSLKNPMSTPTNRKRSSVASRGGKGIGKAPFPTPADSRYSHLGHGKSRKGGKAAMRQFDGGLGSESEISDDSSDAGEMGSIGIGAGRYSKSSGSRVIAHGDDYQGASGVDRSLSSSNSLSDQEADEVQHSFKKERLQSRVLITAAHNNSLQTAEYQPVISKKRGPGRPKKQKDPIIVSREDEMALYTPAVVARKLAGPFPSKTESMRPPVKIGARTEVPFIAYDPEVAEDVMALNAIDSNSSDEEYDTSPAIVMPFSDETSSEIISENSLFGDGDLSDELSGDLSDVLSDDFADFSDDDSLDFGGSSSDNDETSSNSSSSSPREFNYSDMEEQDESLVDSDSSINSISSDDSDTSDSSIESENEIYLQDMSDEEDEAIIFEHDEELIDDEELLRLEEEEERLFLSKAHALHDVFSEEDSDLDRNPFESSDEDDQDEDDDRVFDGDDDDAYSDDYSDDYYDEEFDEMNEQAIIAQLRGIQTDIQAVMMIPPEQQEQLLLLQHYEEIHRQQQEQQSQQPPPRNSPMNEIALDGAATEHNGSMVELLAGTELLPAFDIHVPDLDAVSEQLAASLASSIAESMAGSLAASQARNESLFSTTDAAANDMGTTNGMSDAISSSTDITTFDASTPSVSPESSNLLWATLLPLSPSDTSIPTPANTPIPQRVGAGASPPLSTVSIVEEQKRTQMLGHANTTLSPVKAQTLPTSASYKPLTSLVAAPTIGGRPVQPILPKLAPGETLSDLSPFAKVVPAGSLDISRLPTEGPPAFKETTQKALSGLGSGGDDDASGDTTDDASPDMHGSGFRKRKGSELTSNEGKRRRQSIVISKGRARSVDLSGMQEVQSLSLAAHSDLRGEMMESSTSISLSSTPSSNPMTPLDVATTGVDSSPSSLTPAVSSPLPPNIFDFSKGAMPFMDPSARILTPTSTALKHALRTRKRNIKNKELKQVDVMPMDDLLDTSALYGRSSSRSPSPDRTAAGGDTEMSQTILKDLSRWERVPIGTFRRSRRPSSPYVGLQGALKTGNVTMPATLLAGHQQHQQQLIQESHRAHRTAVVSGKHRLPSSSDVLTLPRRLEADLNAGLGIGIDDYTGSISKSRLNADVMTDSSQLPSSACPTPLHSPLFSATVASSRVHHHSSGEPIVLRDDQIEKSGSVSAAPAALAATATTTTVHIDQDDGVRGEDVSHLELDIGKEMDGFHERLLLAKSKSSGYGGSGGGD
ncbi:hypothetical protein BGZ99_007129 [Dissophora globulifera]|uniref:PHD-type domain-containing protein n=1 Tax=Dissophora globulifera TaxID=979702 RepID=A0A9P6RS53_9FUNG|nr:hypothetical protein BGZ99_007129 [Dissophora globulifera]